MASHKLYLRSRTKRMAEVNSDSSSGFGHDHEVGRVSIPDSKQPMGDAHYRVRSDESLAKSHERFRARRQMQEAVSANKIELIGELSAPQ